MSARIILASQSPYRRELLGRLLPDFGTLSPQVDETRRPGEPPRELALRLARLKAAAGLRRHPDALVIGSDQVAALGDETLGKPGTPDRAVSQLLHCSGQLVEFHTAVCVTGPGDEAEVMHIDTTRVRFRPLTRADAERYVAADQPLDCAGSFKAERRGVLLLECIMSEDPTAIQGLPLIWLGRALIARGVPLL
ncbi:MAG: Maf family nucleotide pyrophosphatase [Gammaproteobacteria bacterium]|nr:Maf family nucleotide pyrophosphatase [Gammaproteobacteria bacterium]